MASSRGLWAATGMAAAITLAACGAAPRDPDAALAAALAKDTADPLIRDTLTMPLATDPDLTSQANVNAIRSSPRVAGNSIPRPLLRADAASALPTGDGKRLAAPAAVPASPCPDCGPDGPATLGALARELARRTPAACHADPAHRLDYALPWAERLPPPFALFPGAALMDAAGAETADCAVRAASVAIAASAQDVIDHYYTQARRAGYTVTHQRLGSHAMLIGARARDKGGLLLIARTAPDGGATVDLVVSESR